MLTRISFAIPMLLASIASADVPRVVTSVAPVQGLVSDIMSGVGAPELLLTEATSPHDFAMRPSQAKAIADADVLFYVGQDLEPWLEKALRSRDSSGLVIALGNMPDLNLLKVRELSEFGEVQIDNASVYDPHMWLDPSNVLIWLDIITGVLEVADPDNKTIYRENLSRTRADIVTSAENARRALAPLSEIELIVTHDSTQYFEEAFGLNIIGAFSASDGQKAGARSLNTLLGKLDPNTCVIAETNNPSRITANLPENIKQVSVDPMGYDQLGAGYYPGLLNSLAESFLECID